MADESNPSLLKENRTGLIIGVLIGILMGTPLGLAILYIPIIGLLILPLWLPLVMFTEGVLGIELDGVCTSLWCNIPYIVFTVIYFGLIGVIFEFCIRKLLKKDRQ